MKVLKEFSANSTITFLDAIMGSGKTTTAIFLLKRFQHKRKFLYVTPYLKEVERLANETGFLKVPILTKDSTNKYLSLLWLLEKNYSIVTTHSLFLRFKMKDYDLLKDYTLVLDEVFEPIEKIKVPPDDIRMALKSGFVSIDNNVVKFNEPDYKGVLTKLKEATESKIVFTSDNRNFFTIIDYHLWYFFKETYILTYKVDSANLCNYFNMNGIQSTSWPAPDIEERKRLKALITILKNEPPSKLKKKKDMNILEKAYSDEFAFSVNWYKELSNEDFKVIRNKVRNVLNRKFKSRSEISAFTTFKDYKDKIADKGYKSGFIALNTKATNDYRMKQNLAYLVNRFPSPEIKAIYENKAKGIRMKEANWALAEMLQWIFRSAIRDGKPINIYIPSDRMARFLEIYLNGNDMHEW